MVQFKTILRSADNSGAQILKCIKVYGGFRRRAAKLGDTVLVSVKKLKHKKKAEKKKMYSAVITAKRQQERRFDGSFIRFDRNKAAIYLQNKFLGTRLYGPICKEIREKNYKNRYTALISVSKGTV